MATTLKKGSTPLEEFDLQKGKVALFVGTELTGLTGTILDRVDEHLRIPIYGFTGSFNISVSVAIILHHLTFNLHRSVIDWKLGKEEKYEIILEWLQKSIRHSGKLRKKIRDKS